MSQLSMDFESLPLSWMRSSLTGMNTLLCGQVCVGTVFKCVQSWRARVGHIGECRRLDEYPSETSAMTAVMAVVRGEMAGLRLEWDDVSRPGVPSSHLYVGDILISMLHPWHASLPTWPEEWQHRPRDMAKGRRAVEAEARLRLTTPLSELSFRRAA